MKLVTNKSKNLLYRIVDAGNAIVQFRTSYAVVTQRTADTSSNLNFKIVGYTKTDYKFLAGELFGMGKLSITFTTPSTTEFTYVLFGVNGSKIDTACRCDMDLKPSTTYTFTCNFTNITQGSISWKDMMLVEGSEAGDYEPYSYNLLDKWKYENTYTSNGVTWTNNGDGSIMANGYATGFTAKNILDNSPVNYTHKYLFNPNYDSDSTNIMYELVFINNNTVVYNFEGRTGSIVDISNYTNILTCRINLKRTYNSTSGIYTYGYAEPALYDLTLMYGAGNEPTTITQFYTDYPELKVSPLGFIGLKNLEISNKNIKRLRYKIWNNSLNLIDKNKFDVSVITRGVTFTNNGDGSWTVNGTSTSQIYISLLQSSNLQLNTAHKYLLSGCPKEGSSNLFLYVDNRGALFGYDTGSGSIGTPTKNIGTITISVSNNTVVNNAIFKPQLYDLTEIYGAGKEPTTVEQFYKDHPLAKTSPLGFSDLGIIPSNSGYILNKYNNLSEELLEENIEKNTVSYHIPDKTNILLNKVEGKTNKIVQIADQNNYAILSSTVGGVTINRIKDGYRLSGICVTSSSYDILYTYSNPQISITKGHKYLLLDNRLSAISPTSTNATVQVLNPDTTVVFSIVDNMSVGAVIGTASQDTNCYMRIKVQKDVTYSNVDLLPQLFDLTAMYGFGKEPTTVEQFKKDYPQFFDSKLDGIWNVRTSGISTTGKNLFDVNNAANNNGSSSYSISNDEIIVTQNSKDNWSSANFPIKNSGELVGKTISISCFAKSDSINKPSIRVQWMTSGGLAVGSIAAISLPSTSTTFIELAASGTVPEKPATADTLRFMFYSNSDGDLSGSTDSIFSCTYKDIQLEISDSATSYEPYTKNKIDLLSTQTLNGINGVNDYIEVIDKGNGLYDLKKTQNIDSVDLGTLDWGKSTVFYIPDASYYIKSNSDGLCKKFLVLNFNKSVDTEDYIETRSDHYLYFRYQSNSIYKDMTPVQFKTAMNGIILYYQLKTPVTTTIAENLTYNQVSAIRTNGGLLLVNDNNNQKYAQPNVTIKSNYQYKN